MSDDSCGSTDTVSGEPCQRAAGWGRDTDGGPCKDHADDDADTGAPAHRPTKLTLERQEGIASMIEAGHSIAAAARSHDIHPQTCYTWLEKGESQDEGIYADFHSRLTRARGEGERQYVAALIEISKSNDDTATLMSMLKQRYPESWGEVDRGEQQGGVNVYLGADETIEIDEETLEATPLDDE